MSHVRITEDSQLVSPPLRLFVSGVSRNLKADPATLVSSSPRLPVVSRTRVLLTPAAPLTSHGLPSLSCQPPRLLGRCGLSPFTQTLPSALGALFHTSDLCSGVPFPGTRPLSPGVARDWSTGGPEALAPLLQFGLTLKGCPSSRGTVSDTLSPIR